MPYFVYILKCSDETLYSGYTKDIDRRVDEHNNSKKGAKYTKARRPVQLAHCEEFSTLSEALKREHQIKKLSRNEKEALLRL